MEIVDKDKAIALLRHAVEIKGEDYVDPNATAQYKSCQYWDESGEPSCIVGHAFAGLGLTQNDLAPYEDSVADIFSRYQNIVNGVEAWTHVARNAPVALTPEAVDVFSEAQGVQDLGGTWGKALVAAESVWA